MRARAAALGACLALTGCVSPPPHGPGPWLPLFDGATTAGWRNVGKATLDPRWQARDGALVLTEAGGGDIASEARFGDFELEFEWRLAAGGNSGVFYRAPDVDPAWRHAPEYQLLDDAAAEDRFVASHRAGAVYDLVAPDGARLRPRDAFNHARIVACGARVEHWLNGVRVAAYDLDSADWRSRVAASKFATEAGFATRRQGHIAFQDHGSPLQLRGLRIRELAGCD